MPAAGDVSVVGMILVALSAIEVAFSAIEEVLVAVDEVLVVVDEVVVQEMEEVEAVSSSIIMGRLDGVVVGEGVSDSSDGGDGSEEERIYSRLFISTSMLLFAMSSSADRNNCEPRCSFLVLEYRCTRPTSW